MSVTSYVASNGMEPIPLTSITPDAGPQKPPVNTAKAASADSSGNAASTTANAGAEASTDEEGFTFWDVLDMVNPLQHIPIVSSIYREVTGDKIGDVARVVGGTLLGGPIGAAIALVDVGVNQASGKHIDEHMMAMIKGDGTAADGQASTTVASTGTDNGESAFNVLGSGQSGGLRRAGTVEVRAVGGTEAKANQPSPETSAMPLVSSNAQPLVSSNAQPLAANSASPIKAAPVQPTDAKAADASATAQNGKRFSLNRGRDTRTGDVAPVRLESEFPTVNKPQIRQSAPSQAPGQAPAANAANAANATAASLPLSLTGGESQGTAPVNSTEQAAAAAPISDPSLPLGMIAPRESAVPTGTAQPSADALYRALQAQGLEPNQHPALAPAEKAQAQQHAASNKSARSHHKAISAADSAEMGTAIMPLGMGGDAAPATSAAAPLTPQAQTTQAQTSQATQAAQTGPTQVPAWFDKAMQKALASYEKTGSLAGTTTTAANGTNATPPSSTVE